MLMLIVKVLYYVGLEQVPVFFEWLQVMAVIDNLFLLATGLSQMFTATTLYNGITSHWFSVYLRTLVWPLVHITQMLTVYMTVIIACNRYIAVCHPYRAERLCSLTVVRLKVSHGPLYIQLGAMGKRRR